MRYSISFWPHHVLGRMVVACVISMLSMNAAMAAPTGTPQTLLEIQFEGNERTKNEVMLRELPIKPGDGYTAELAELGRQQIQNLGLFRSVTWRSEAAERGVNLIYRVEEKWFWQAYPRLSANSDGQNSVGLEARISNLWGLNHSLKLLGRSRDTRDADRGRDVSIRTTYNAPYLLGDRESLRFSVAHNTIPYEQPEIYDETVDEIEAVATRIYGLPDRPSQGWSTGLGTVWRRQSVSDETLARSFGSSYGLVTEVGYRNGRDLIFSNDGTFFDARFEVADRSVLSDYSYSILRVDWGHALLFGERAHQQLSYGVSFGVGNHALDHRALFSLGGSEGLRGYERKAFEGNTYYLGHVDLMRPLIWDSLRGTIGLEIGNAGWATNELFDSPNVSLNLGLRLRPRRLVNFEIEIGFAIPLSGEDPRFYGGKVDRP